MKKIICIAALLCSASWLSGCKDNNPILKEDPNVFAQQVNAFMDKDMGNMVLKSCIGFYVDPNSIKNEPFYSREMQAEFVSSCDRTVDKLVVFLNTNKTSNLITASNLHDAATWKHYYQAKKARRA